MRKVIGWVILLIGLVGIVLTHMSFTANLLTFMSHDWMTLISAFIILVGALIKA